jgi:hypothetical protein
MDSSLRNAQSMQHSPLKVSYGKTYYKRTVLLWWDWMSKKPLTPLGGHAYLAIYGTYNAQKSVQPDSQLLQRQGSFSSSKHIE